MKKLELNQMEILQGGSAESQVGFFCALGVIGYIGLLTTTGGAALIASTVIGSAARIACISRLM